MTIYNSIKQTGRYLLATGALLTALYSCDNKSNFNNQPDLTARYDASLPDLENILEDAGLELTDIKVGVRADVYEPDVYIPIDGSDFYRGDLGYILDEDSSIDIPLDDLYDIHSELGNDAEEDYVLIPAEDLSEEINLEDLLDNSREDTDPCVNNHPPTIYARTEPPSGSTITLDEDRVGYIIDGAEDPDGNLDICYYDTYLDDEYWFTAEDFECEGTDWDRFHELGTHRIEFYAKDTCGVESARVISILYAIEN